MNQDKQEVHDFWDKASCGEALYLAGMTQADYEAQAQVRYELEPYIKTFAKFEEATGKQVLEIGVGLGADHQQFAQAGALLHGIDLTERAIEHTQRRFALFGLQSELKQGDAENLPYADNSFDVVYSWGVLHHSPNTAKAIEEVYRVLKPGGEARIMVYYTWSLVGFMLWLRYGLFRLKPWTSLASIYSSYLESPGTKAYTIPEARQLFKSYANTQIETVLTHGDLLESAAGQRHSGLLLTIARKIWPRSLIKRYLKTNGLFMLITAKT